MEPLRTGARLLSRGMRGGNGLITLAGALLVARAILRWLDGPGEEQVYSRTLKPGEEMRVVLRRLDDRGDAQRR